MTDGNRSYQEPGILYRAAASGDARLQAGIDRELLELAAKAAGYTHHKYDENEGLWINDGNPDYGYDYWNPLIDDGDALRLLTSLGLSLKFLDGFKQVQVYRADSKVSGVFALEGYGVGADRTPDFGNIRRAIVRAAAEIGKAMP